MIFHVFWTWPILDSQNDVENDVLHHLYNTFLGLLELLGSTFQNQYLLLWFLRFFGIVYTIFQNPDSPKAAATRKTLLREAQNLQKISKSPMAGHVSKFCIMPMLPASQKIVSQKHNMHFSFQAGFGTMGPGPMGPWPSGLGAWMANLQRMVNVIAAWLRAWWQPEKRGHQI